jgi:hypothetical protein
LENAEPCGAKDERHFEPYDEDEMAQIQIGWKFME